MRILLIVLAFLIIGALIIIGNGNLSVLNSEDLGVLVESYFSWLWNLVKNAGSITGNAVNLRWLPSGNFSS